jgi:uncharacterized membrane protein YesL
MGGFYRISEWIMRLSAINLLWAICSIPTLFLLLAPLMSPGTVDPNVDPNQMLAEFGAMMFWPALSAPFFLIPASAAMFAVARKWVMGDVDVPLFKTFFRNYKENYKQSMLGGLIFLALGFMIVQCIIFYSGMDGIVRLLSFLFISFCFVYAAALINFLCMTVHFEMKLIQLVKNSFIMTLGQPFTSIGSLVTSGVIIWISFTKFTFLIPFFMGSLCAIASFWYFYRSFQRIQDKAEKAREKEALKEMGLDESVQTKE